MRNAMIGLLAIIATPAIAAGGSNLERHYTPTYNQCMERAGGVDPEMRSCFQAEQERWDKDLNAAYQRTMSRLPADRQVTLRREERAWIRRKEHTCSHAGDDNQGGTLQLLEIDQCYLDETIRRTLTLQAQ